MSSNSPAIGAALHYAQNEIGGPLNETDRIVQVTGTPQILIQPNGDRVGLLVVNLSASTISMSLSNIGVIGQAISLTDIGSAFEVDVKNDLTLPSRGWYMYVAGGTANAYVLEVFRTMITPTGGQ